MYRGIAVLTPFAFPSVRGNAVTAERIVRALRRRGVDLQVWDLSVTPQAVVQVEVEAFQPALIQGFHAFRVGPLALRLARRADVPLVVTLTGTDVNHDLFDPERAAILRRVLEGASTLIVFHDSIASRVLTALPHLAGRLVVVPQSVALPTDERLELQARWTLPAERVLFVLPGGIRPVKNPRFPVRPLERLVARHPALRLLYAGPLLDPGESEALLRTLGPRPWARHIGTVPHAQMASLLGQADVVLNCSVSEGGMANSVLEALFMERAVLVSDIEGNRSLVEEGVTGLLFRDEAAFESGAERLALDPALRGRLGRTGHERVARLCSAEREAEGYLDVYRRFVPVPST